MSGVSISGPSIESVEDALRSELAQGDSILASTRPVLSHLLATGDQISFSDAVIAHIRGMANDCARQLLRALEKGGHEEALTGSRDADMADMANAMLRDEAYLSHTHALTLEALLTERLLQRSGIDPVLSPLLQEIAASKDASIARSAMHVLSAQARFIQQQRRMELPLNELPGDLFYKALLTMRACDGVDEEIVTTAEARLRQQFDEGNRRTGQITRLIMALDRKANRALALDHAGLAIFVTALALASSQDREIAVLSLGENQLARLALSLRAAGLSQSSLDEQFLFLHPDIALPVGFEGLSAQRAASLLASSQMQAES